jgi:SNF2 family DNA or RNA helicase
MEMGTGKTKVILDEWGARVHAGDLDSLLVVAPAGAYSNWWRVDDDDPGEVQKHVDPELFGKIEMVPWISGAGKLHRKKYADLLAVGDRPRVLVVNVEALSTIKEARQLCNDFLRSGRGMMVVDESTTIKNPTAKRTEYCFELGQLAAARRIMTGLVAPRDPLDLWSQFAFLDYRILRCKSFWGYKTRYAIIQQMNYGGRKVRVVVGYRHTDELHDLIGPYSYRKLKEECLDLPPRTYMRREVPLTPDQARVYEDLRKKSTSELNEGVHITATIAIAQILRMDQVLCGHVVDELGNMHDVPDYRIDELIAVLQEHEGKAIIWTAYDRCIHKIAARLTKEFGEGKVARFWGGNRATRAADELRFKTDPACKYMVATPAAGGLGNTWVVADLVVYHSNTHDLGLREQSEARAHRDGQTRPVTYVDLVAPGTVDEKKLKCLRKKMNMAQVINGDNYREWLI